ncbi:MAG: hypothetical protein RR531_13525 [Longicatena sp.]
MATTGLSKPFVAKYSSDGSGKVSFSDLQSADKLVEYSVDITSTESNPLHADNMIQENDPGSFSSGKLKVKTTEFTGNMSEMFLNAKVVKRNIGDKEVDEIVFDDDMIANELAYGLIEEHIIDGVKCYLPIVFPRVLFSIPGTSATTRADKIEWQTPEIEGIIYRSDQSDVYYNHPWRLSPKEPMSTELDAEKYIRAVLAEKEITPNGEQSPQSINVELPTPKVKEVSK